MIKIRKNIIVMVVLAMLLQIVLPMASNVVFAEGEAVEDVVELVVSETEEEAGTLKPRVPEEPVEEENPDEPVVPGDGEEMPGETEEGIEPEDQEQPVIDGDQNLQYPTEEELLGVPDLGVVDTSEPKDLGNIFTFNFLKLDGKEINDGDVIEIEDDTIVAIEFAWDTRNLDAIEGDWATIQLADIFKDVTINNLDIIVNSEDGLVSVGKYSINNGELKFVFNENIEDIKNGVIGLGLKFDLEKFKEDVQQEIKFNDSKDTTLTVIAKPTGVITGIDKEGHPDKEHDAKEITWTVDVLNDGDSAIKNAKVSDTIPEGLELIASSFIVKELTVGYLGYVIIGGNVTVTLPTDKDKFEITFDSMEPYKGYRIEYTTKIVDYTKVTFTNDATLSYGEKTLPADATVGGLTRSNPIEKNGGYDNSTGLIEWQIFVNKSGSEIENAIVHDNLPDGLSIVPGSIKVYKVVDGKSTPVDNINTENFPTTPITLGELESTDEYEIRFTTSINYSEVNGGDYQKHNEFTNETELKNGEITVGEADKKVELWRDPILRKVGNSNVNYNNKTLTWTVHVNEAGHPLTGVTLTDLIPAGLGISKDKIVINGKDGVINLADGSITITPITSGDDKDKTEVKIHLGDIATEKITITYTTTIEDFTIDIFNNIASLEGEGIGEGGSINPVPIIPAKNTFEKSYKGIDYNEKKINWELKVDPNREDITELKIVDTFPNKGMILLPDTLVVKLGSSFLTKGTDYTLAPNTEGEVEGYQKGFTLTLEVSALPLNSALVITYKTSYDPEVKVEGDVLDPHTNAENQSKKYINKAQFTGKTVNDNKIDLSKEASTTVREDSWNSGKKEGQLIHFDDSGTKKNGWVSGSERKIAWQVYINYQKQNLGTGVEVVDTSAYQGTIEQDNIVVSVYNVQSGGDTTITNTVLSDDYYDVTFDEDGKFTLKFEDNFVVSERYVIEFLTTVPDISQEKYTNNVVVKVGGVDYPYSATLNYNKHNNFLDKNALGLDSKNVFTGDEVDWEVKVNESLSIVKNSKIVDTISKGLVYVNDSLEVYKLVGSEEILLVEGTDYTFAKSTTATEKTALTLVFTKDVDTTLILRYKTIVTATQNTVNNSVDFSGDSIETITKESESLNAKQFSYVGGQIDPKKGMIRLTKLDSETEKVIVNNAAKFTLWYRINPSDETYLQFGDEEFTTTNGVLELINLPLRTYYLREVEAPIGYVLPNGEIEIVVNKKYNNIEGNIFLKDIENTKIKIEVAGTKVWDGGPKPAIELQLYRNEIKFGDTVILNGTEAIPWSHTWTDLDEYDDNSEKYDYTVKEVKIGDAAVIEGEVVNNYRESVEKNDDGIFVITNTYVIQKIEVEATKEWENGPTRRPTVWFKLYRQILGGDIEEVPNASIQELADGTTKVAWEDLDETDFDGNPYIFSVKEVDAEGNDYKPVSYEKAQNGLTITNSYVSPTDASAKAIKVWVNGPLEKPTLWLKLYRHILDGSIVEVPTNEAPIKELASGITEVVWTGLTKTDIDGNPYFFSVKEVDEEGNDFEPVNYTKVEEGLTVTNTYVIPKTEITGSKQWVGGPTKKPTIELQLDQNGVEHGDPVTLADGTASYTWTELDETDINGKTHVYTVDEVKVPAGYRKVILEDGLTVRNTIIPDELDNPEGRIRIIKRDSDTRELLAGAEFDIIDSRGRVVDTLVTNSRGETTSKYLPIGRYTIEETKAPKGYILEAEVGDERVTDGVTVEVVVYNDKEDEPEKPTEPGKPVTPTTPTTPTTPVTPVTPSTPDEFENVDGDTPEGTTSGTPDEFEDGGGKIPSDVPTLPKTGQSSSSAMMIAGLALVLVGIFLKRKTIQ